MRQLRKVSDMQRAKRSLEKGPGHCASSYTRSLEPRGPALKHLAREALLKAYRLWHHIPAVDNVLTWLLSVLRHTTWALFVVR